MQVGLSRKGRFKKDIREPMWEDSMQVGLSRKGRFKKDIREAM